LIGFFVSFIAGVLGMFGLFIAGGVVILPGVVAHFFLGATSGVFGNATGGLKGAVAGSFLNGLIITFLPVAFLPLVGDLGNASTTFSDTVLLGIGMAIGDSNELFGKAGIIGLVILLLVAAIGFKSLVSKKGEEESVEQS